MFNTNKLKGSFKINSIKSPIVLAKKVYGETVNLSPNSSSTLIFTDIIIKGNCFYEFNQFAKNDKATMLNFPDAASHLMLLYLDVYLEGRQINTVVIYVGINNILRDRSQSNIDGLL